MAHEDPEIDKKFDARLKEDSAKGDCVVTTWLGPWMVDADYCIWVEAPLEVRAERLAKREGIPIEDALLHIKKRDADNRERYLKLYGIDILEHEDFDLKISSEKHRPIEMVNITLSALKKDKNETRQAER